MKIKSERIMQQQSGAVSVSISGSLYNIIPELTDFSGHVQPIGAMPPPPVPDARLGRLGGGGPRTHLPIALPFPAKFRKALPTPGYQAAHAHFLEMRDQLQKQVFAFKKQRNREKAQVIVVTVQLMTRAPGKVKPIIVSVCNLFLMINNTLLILTFKNITETFGNVPVDIGVEDLKTACHITVQPLFLNWLKGVSLDRSEVQLRFKNWLELVPQDPDMNAIADKFIVAKGRNGAKKFAEGHGITLYLAISYEKYERALAHSIDELSESDDVSDTLIILLHGIF